MFSAFPKYLFNFWSEVTYTTDHENDDDDGKEQNAKYDIHHQQRQGNEGILSEGRVPRPAPLIQLGGDAPFFWLTDVRLGGHRDMHSRELFFRCRPGFHEHGFGHGSEAHSDVDCGGLSRDDQWGVGVHVGGTAGYRV